MFVDGDHIGHTPAGAVTVHGQGKSWRTETRVRTGKSRSHHHMLLLDKVRLLINGLTVDNKLLCFLLGHSLAILSIDKPVNVQTAGPAHGKRLPRQKAVQCRKDLVEQKP